MRDTAMLKAVGLNAEGKRRVLGVSVSLSVQEIHWRTLPSRTRAETGVELLVSDVQAGLKQARRAVFGGAPWQRCQFHLQQNAQAHLPRHSLKAEVVADIRTVFNTPNRDEVEALLARLVKKTRSERLAWPN